MPDVNQDGTAKNGNRKLRVNAVPNVLTEVNAHEHLKEVENAGNIKNDLLILIYANNFNIL